ncbi:MAG: hypothetical protein QXI89_00905, partial [Candidatus Anstonellales archaeon]
ESEHLAISLPASITNFGPAFDTLGMALNLRNVFLCQRSSYYKIYAFEHSLDGDIFYEAYKKASEKFGSFNKIKVEAINKIPPCSGLGSSATAIIAGILAAAFFNGINYRNYYDEILKLAYEIEGHYDNLLPCLFGNLVSVMNQPFNYDIYKECPYNVFIFLPNLRTKTSEARKALPDLYKIDDVLYNLQRAISIIEALKQGNTKKLFELVKDKIHQPYRLALHNTSILEEAINASSLPCFLSGSGPAIAILYNKKRRKERILIEKTKNDIASILKKLPSGFRTFDLRMARKGVIMIK